MVSEGARYCPTDTSTLTIYVCCYFQAHLLHLTVFVVYILRLSNCMFMSKLWSNFSIPQKQVKELINFWNQLVWNAWVNLCTDSHIKCSKTRYPLFHSCNFKVLFLYNWSFWRAKLSEKLNQLKKNAPSYFQLILGMCIKEASQSFCSFA